MARVRNEGPKVDEEIELVGLMTQIYCHGNHGTRKGELCPECAELLDYARARVHACPRMEEKTFCSTCPVHCYRPAMRERMRAVMRYAGPRMLFVRPVPALKHCVNTLRARLASR
jgi:predicted amidophosphoribosyltransferase